MAFGRRKRGGLLQTAARTAVITGTAAATSNAVHNRAARGQAAAAPAAAAAAEAPPQAAQAAGLSTAPESPSHQGLGSGTVNAELLDHLAKLGELHTAGVLTDEEFTQLKLKAIG
ncbi:SHOCT domain-containing protein [Plantibacter sp. Mn2098]|uniref:SHOCT domain-containing protein n=1 Tax=Plantibacter sp. Mn2098 TaxID=3395266 RepID=UPI003BDA46D6